MHSDITAVRFKGTNGFLSIFNIYNEITNNDTLTCLDLFLDLNAPLVQPTNSDGVLWISDFNHHHPMWEEDSNEHLFEPEEYISPLIDLLYKNDMLLALPKGIPTLQTPTGNWTRPDNVWRNNTPLFAVIQSPLYAHPLPTTCQSSQYSICPSPDPRRRPH